MAIMHVTAVVEGRANVTEATCVTARPAGHGGVARDGHCRWGVQRSRRQRALLSWLSHLTCEGESLRNSHVTVTMAARGAPGESPGEIGGGASDRRHLGVQR